MFSSLLRPKYGRRRVQQSPSSSPYVDQSSPLLARQQRFAPRHATADFTETEADDSNSEDEDRLDAGGEGPQEDDNEGGVDEDGEEETHLLPLFSAAHLGQDSIHLQDFANSNS